MGYRNYSVANGFVVDKAGNGDFTTIATATTASVAGDTIFIRPGTYTENFTMVPGVNYCAFECDAQTPNVSIVGKITMTGAGTCSISGIRLTTNSDYFLEITGSAASAIVLENCYLNCSNNSGMHLTSSGGSSITALYCAGNIGTTSISLFVGTAGTITMKYCDIENSGGATTASTGAAMTFYGEYCIFGFVFSFTTTGVGAFYYCYFNNGGVLNTTAVTTAGTGSGHNMFQCIVTSGSASAVSIGSGTTMTIQNSSINSTNTNAITGAGTLDYAGLVFPNTSKTINTTTQSDENFGTFVPAISIGGSILGITYSGSTAGWYQRNDSMVNFALLIQLTSKGSQTGGVLITGLPFTSSADNSFDYLCTLQNITEASGTYSIAELSTSSTSMTPYFITVTTGTYTQMTNTALANNTVMRVSGHYYI